jgi:suppressor for copper-sensitivity B
MKKFIRRGLFLTACTTIIAMSSGSASLGAVSGWVQDDQIAMRIITGKQDDNKLSAALEVKLDQDWHSYWRMPGDAGLAPEFDWSHSQNIDDIDLSWPTPTRFITFDLQNFGYAEAHSYPLDITITDPAEPIVLALNSNIMICKDICIPKKLSLTFTVPTDPSVEETVEHQGQIEWAQNQLPVTENTPSLKIEQLVLGPNALVINAFSKNKFENFDVFVDSGETYITAQPTIEHDEDDPRKAMIRIAAPDGVEDLATLLMNHEITIVLVDGSDAIERSFTF